MSTRTSWRTSRRSMASGFDELGLGGHRGHAAKSQLAMQFGRGSHSKLISVIGSHTEFSTGPPDQLASESIPQQELPIFFPEFPNAQVQQPCARRPLESLVVHQVMPKPTVPASIISNRSCSTVRAPCSSRHSGRNADFRCVLVWAYQQEQSPRSQGL